MGILEWDVAFPGMNDGRPADLSLILAAPSPTWRWWWRQSLSFWS